MKKSNGNRALCCSDCGATIEEYERVEYDDLDAMTAECHRCAQCSHDTAYLCSASIQRFLIGNVV